MAQYKKISKNIQQITLDNPRTTNDKLVWLNINNTGKDEIEFLRKKYNFKLSQLQASLAKATAQRPMVEQGDSYLFIILHFPIFKEGSIVPAEIEFFIGHGYLITIHNNNIPTLNEFFNVCKKGGDSTLAYQYESSAVLLYEILEKLLLNCYSLLDKNSIRINDAEEIIFAQMQKRAVSSILSLRHNIINFRKIMQNHRNIIRKLTQMKSSIIPSQQIKAYYNKLIDHSKNIWEILEIQKEMIEVLNNTNESLMNYRLSNIMKTLTIFSVIVFPLSLLAAIFGMNVEDGMPFLGVKNGFWIIVAIMIVSCFFMLLFFEKKKWL
ncbi:hypothetical protein CO116_00580 [Candidatus Falkowbacteria bacterium CG_4_9_14_3_um_filter_38_19]|uniref:Magnesium transport protein CorA n=1 Tax=Candidatus Falkowbacteria bacterium CG_4_9_14_3_um_filter_38_19 TaxID=1974559 RepID=A0A2M8AJP1_9BACT|nr:MAG: hypothetical protein CO116_00580 [Candidatus Falkowbacteria bacterium CG_4_9_14_3_um_filter_38_19]